MNTATNDNKTAKDNKKQTMSPPFNSLLFADDLIWSGQILSFVGVGQYAFVGAVNKKMHQLYKDYCKIELRNNPKKVKDYNIYYNPDSRSAEITDTLYSETFCIVPRAEIWRNDTSSNKTPDRDQVCNAIARIGNITGMQWARQQGFPWNEQTCRLAASNGHLEMLQWLYENGCSWNVQTCALAAQNGHLDVLKWARENGCPWNETTCNCAAYGGHLELLKWTGANGCPWDEETCEGAAQKGHLEILIWLRQNGCPWDHSTCSYAAQGGHLDTLKWARANGCPWNERTCTKAAENDHLETLHWALANGCPWDEETFRAARVYGFDNTEAIQWLRNNGYPGVW